MWCKNVILGHWIRFVASEGAAEREGARAGASLARQKLTDGRKSADKSTRKSKQKRSGQQVGREWDERGTKWETIADALFFSARF